MLSDVVTRNSEKGSDQVLDEAEFKSERTRAFVRHWSSLPREGLLPWRHVFDPSDARSLLPYLVIRELHEDGNSTFRLVGTELSRLLGFDATGQPGTKFFSEAYHEQYRAHSRAMFTQPCGIHAVILLRSPSGKLTRTENVSFPFLVEGQDVRHTIGIIAPLDDTATRTHPEIFSILQVESRRFLDIGAGVPADAP